MGMRKQNPHGARFGLCRKLRLVERTANATSSGVEQVAAHVRQSLCIKEESFDSELRRWGCAKKAAWAAAFHQPSRADRARLHDSVAHAANASSKQAKSLFLCFNLFFCKSHLRLGGILAHSRLYSSGVKQMGNSVKREKLRRADCPASCALKIKIPLDFFCAG